MFEIKIWGVRGAKPPGRKNSDPQMKIFEIFSPDPILEGGYLKTFFRNPIFEGGGYP